MGEAAAISLQCPSSLRVPLAARRVVQPAYAPHTPVRRAPQDAYRTPPPTEARQQLSAISGPATTAGVTINLRGPTPVKQQEYWANVARAVRNDIPTDADDFTLYTIATADRDRWAQNTYEEVKRELVDTEWQNFVESVYGTNDKDAEQQARGLWAKFMDKVIEASGEKPSPGDPRVVYVPIQGTRYFLRFWPGSFTWAEYCMDFVQTNNRGERVAVNVPEGYAVWTIPDSDSSPWLSPACSEITSIERAHGIQPKDIKPGEEKYIMRDGMTCQLVRDGEALFRFQVPRRPGVYGGDRDSPNDPIIRPTRM
ncbi:hypothetical protein NUW54_g5420 [Trametes sanguinea]|uniref:Uncharacterized protein n=1 Tax=Trametes sanguinea TaxID=158606 RepID=A0ACC1PV64_9APHY|nr:hypothetical protein NUW54_g5420 [Trametes sanguinea]